MSKGKLYLIPALLGNSPLSYSMPPDHTFIINRLERFIVENERTARRYLIRAGYKNSIDSTEFLLLNKYTTKDELPGILLPVATEGKHTGLLSEAGCPGIADPGAEIVKLAHEMGIQVIPLVGPSSITLAVMASGFIGQNFAFNGYLPIDKKARFNAIKELEKKVYKDNQAQVFIETPYRNNQLLKDIVKACRPGTALCIACDLTLENEFIKTKTISDWSKTLPGIHKRPAVFLLYK